jgi:hypothetical protein
METAKLKAKRQQPIKIMTLKASAKPIQLTQKANSAMFVKAKSLHSYDAIA